MGWIQDRLRTRSFKPGQSPNDNPELHFAEAARRRWQQLGDELKSDLAEFNSHQKALILPIRTKMNFGSATLMPAWKL
jgi:hypothetical protein